MSWLSERTGVDIDLTSGDPVGEIIDGTLDAINIVGEYVAGGLSDVGGDIFAAFELDDPANSPAETIARLALATAAIVGVVYVGKELYAYATDVSAAEAAGTGADIPTMSLEQVGALETEGGTTVADVFAGASPDGVSLSTVDLGTIDTVSQTSTAIDASSLVFENAGVVAPTVAPAATAATAGSSWVPYTIVGSSLISAGLEIEGMSAATEAAGEAAAASTAATEAAIAEERRQFDLYMESTATARAAGEAAITGMEGMEKFEGSEATRFTPGTFTGETEFTGGPGKFDYKPYEKLTIEELKADPSYDFRFGEGVKAVQASQIGRNLSGRAAKELTRFGSDFASQEYGRADERKYRNWINDIKIRHGIHSEEYNNAVGEFERQFQKEYGMFTDVENRKWDVSNEMYNREAGEYGTELNRLSTLAGYGNTANIALGGAGMASAGNIGSYGMRNATNQGNLALGTAAINNQGWSNIWGNILTGGENLITWDQYNQ